MLSGYRSYIIAALGVIYAVSAYLTGHLDMNAALAVFGSSAGLAALRSAISNIPTTTP